MTDLQQFDDERAQGEAAATTLRTTQAVRERCGQLLARARAGGSDWFEVDGHALERAAREAAARVRPRHPPPLQTVWRHLEAGGVDRRDGLERLLQALTPGERTHARVDLAVIACLLAGDPGSGWSYAETRTGQTLRGPAGLCVATLHAFAAGLFSGDPQRPLQADALGLRALVTDHLALALQVRASNPLPDLPQRAIRLRRLGEWMSEQPEACGDPGRPAGIFDIIISPYGHGIPHTADVHAHDILSQVLVTLSGLSPQAPRLGGVPLGDCWRHEAVRGDGSSDGWLPLHGLAQALAGSLLEPFAWGGVALRGLDALTPIATLAQSQRLLDAGVLRLRDPQAARHPWTLADTPIVEWRALGLALLDAIALRVRETLGLDADTLPGVRLWPADPDREAPDRTQTLQVTQGSGVI